MTDVFFMLYIEVFVIGFDSIFTNISLPSLGEPSNFIDNVGVKDDLTPYFQRTDMLKKRLSTTDLKDYL